MLKSIKSLSAANQVIANNKLLPVIEQYTNLVNSINAEYAIAKEIENNFYVSLLELIECVKALMYTLLKVVR